MVNIIQVVFCGVNMVEDSAWQALLFMANVGGYSRGIGLLEVNCKSIDTIMYICLGKAIMLQYVLH